ncbi:MAG TPA: hypothetical protein VGC36_00255, partial [Rhizomicrobium sp.]
MAGDGDSQAKWHWRLWALALAAALVGVWPGVAAGRTATPSVTASPIPTSVAGTSTPTLAPTPLRTGDLGIKRVVGRVTEAFTDPPRPIADAEVMHSLPDGGASVFTDADGQFAFDRFIHDTDRIAIDITAAGYESARLVFTGTQLWFNSTPLEVGLERRYRVAFTVARSPYCDPSLPIVVTLNASLSGEPRVLSVIGGGAAAFAGLSPGTYEISAATECPLTEYDAQTITIATADVDVDFTPDPCPSAVQLNPPSGPPGTALTVTGRCYYIHSGKQASISFDGAHQLDIIGETAGDYSGAFRVPNDAAPGPHEVAVNWRGGPIGQGQFLIVDTAGLCLGDCNGDERVGVDELVTMV